MDAENTLFDTIQQQNIERDTQMKIDMRRMSFQWMLDPVTMGKLMRPDTEFDFELCKSICDKIAETLQPEIDFTECKTYEDAMQLVEEALKQYKEDVAKAMGYDTADAMLKAAAPGNPEKMGDLLFNLFQQEYMENMMELSE